jgi:hypothetical protein
MGISANIEAIDKSMMIANIQPKMRTEFPQKKIVTNANVMDLVMLHQSSRLFGKMKQVDVCGQRVVRDRVVCGYIQFPGSMSDFGCRNGRRQR